MNDFEDKNDTDKDVKKGKRTKRDDEAFLKLMRERAERAYNANKENYDAAMDDLKFRAGKNQWNEATISERRKADRPCLVINQIPKFIRQITGEIRQMRPAMRAYGVDDVSDQKKAEIITQILRYIEFRSSATTAYYAAADSQVTCGIGHWRVSSKYSGEGSDYQDLHIELIQDGASVLWDPDAIEPCFEDAAFCFVPVDMSYDVFKEKFPHASHAGFENAEAYNTHTSSSSTYWTGGDKVRIAEYWTRECPKNAKPIVKRYLVTSREILEANEDYVGRYIPIVPLVGEEIRYGQTCIRHGVVRFMKDSQRAYNYFASAEVEIVALQPKAPFIATVENVRGYEKEWASANIDNAPFLPYNPDPLNGGREPNRVQPPVSSQGLSDGLMRAVEEMKSVSGIYDASLGARSNETSGIAIKARMAEGDTGTYVYIDNFAKALRYSGKVCVDLIPHYYDTQRTLRIIGEDGKQDEVKINLPAQNGELEAVLSDVTIGDYDVHVDMGATFATKREEAKEGMIAFLQAVPQAAPLVADLIASNQDWPDSKKFAERLQALLPPEIKQKEAQENGDPEQMQAMQPQQPPPEMIMQMQAQEAAMQHESRKQEIEMRVKELQLEKTIIELENAKQLAQIKLRTALADAAGKNAGAQMRDIDNSQGYEEPYEELPAMPVYEPYSEPMMQEYEMPLEGQEAFEPPYEPQQAL